jgi:dihydroflavonol-4-reductase
MVIVTGATGHIGSALIQELVNKNIEVRALVLPEEETPFLSHFPVEVVRGDVTDYFSLLKAFEGMTDVYHLAGIVSIGSGKMRILQKVNVEGTNNVIKACFEKKIKRLLYVSSIHAFTELPHGKVITESKNFDPDQVVGDYAKSKALATHAVLEAVHKGLDAVIVHPTGVIGPYEYETSHTGQLITDFLKGRLYAYIEGSYDFVDVRDVARGIVLACEKGRIGENYILSGEQVTVKQILSYLEDATGLKGPEFKIPFWLAKWTAPLSEVYYKILRQKPLYTPYSIYTISSNSLTTHRKATEELGYNHRPIRETILDTVGWMKSQKFSNAT